MSMTDFNVLLGKCVICGREFIPGDRIFSYGIEDQHDKLVLCFANHRDCETDQDYQVTFGEDTMFKTGEMQEIDNMIKGGKL